MPCWGHVVARPAIGTHQPSTRVFSLLLKTGTRGCFVYASDRMNIIPDYSVDPMPRPSLACRI
jgi:hypothetical protein